MLSGTTQRKHCVHAREDGQETSSSWRARDVAAERIRIMKVLKKIIANNFHFVDLIFFDGDDNAARDDRHEKLRTASY